MQLSCEPEINSPMLPVFRYRELLEKMKETDDSGVVYPERDGEPMGETEIHVRVILHLYQSLMHFFRHHPDVYTVADMLMYYEKGNPKAVKVPDVMVVKGVEKHIRRNFKIWEEKTAPSVIFEITSKSTASEDIAKTGLYTSLGVREYFLFDPLREYIEESLMGFRMDIINCRPISPDENGDFFSEELGLKLRQEGHLLRLVDPETDRAVPSLEEAALMAEKEAIRAEEESIRAEEEALRAAEAEKRAQEEALRAAEEARKAARLAAKLREMGIDPESV
ncbi:MAG: Uma2 family endonuclease [Desulfobacterales bacterium]